MYTCFCLEAGNCGGRRSVCADRPSVPAANSSPFCSFPLEVQLLTVVSPLSPLSIALPYVSSVTPLSTAFTHFDRGGRVRTFSTFRHSDIQTFRLSDPSTCRPSSTIIRIFKSLPSLGPLFAAFFSLVSFIFRRLRPLFAHTAGGQPQLWLTS